jgi:hypothetical protein
MENNGNGNGKSNSQSRLNAAGLLLVGTALGAGMMAAKKQAHKTPVQKMMDRLNHR